MRKKILFLTPVLFPLFVLCQIPLEKKLIQEVADSRSDTAKISALGKLAEFYTIYRADKKADSVLEKQLALAEVSNDERVLKQALFGNAINILSAWTGKETFERALNFIQKGLDYAKQTSNSELETIAYLRKASLLRKRKMYEPALQQATVAFTTLNKDGDDSLKAEIHLEIGNIFLAKMDIVTAYKNFNAAYELAYHLKDIALQSATLHQLSDLYKSIENYELAKTNLLESVNINLKANNQEGLLVDYIDLFRLSSEKEYLDRAFVLANATNSIRYRLYCKKLNFFYVANNLKKSDEALNYLQQNSDLYQSFVYQGLINYYIGSIYQYSGRPATAINYYKLEEPLMVQAYDPAVQTDFFTEMAQCYSDLNETDKAIEYYEKTYQITQVDSLDRSNADVTFSLYQLYGKKNNYQKAYEYSQLYYKYKNQQSELAEQREVALLAFDREKKKSEKDLQDAVAEELRRRNLQYTGISMATAFLFILLLVFGMFPISKTTIRMLNFFSFICLFEFIILLIDNWLHDITHGAPLKIWIAKIFVIALLLPLHHALEHITIKFLSSEKLIRFRRALSIKKLWHPSKQTVKKIEENLEEGTLV